MWNFTIPSRLTLVVVPVMLVLSSCEEAPRFTREACVSGPTQECLLYFAHQAAREISDDTKRNVALWRIAERQVDLGDAAGALSTAADLQTLHLKSLVQTRQVIHWVQEGELERAREAVASLGEAIPHDRWALEELARARALTGDIEGAIDALDSALVVDAFERAQIAASNKRLADAMRHYNEEMSKLEPARSLTAATTLGKFFEQRQKKRARVRSEWQSSNEMSAKRQRERAAFKNDRILRAIAMDLARNSQASRAIEFVREIADSTDRARASVALSKELAKAGHARAGRQAANIALEIATAASPGLERVRLLTDVVEALAALSRPLSAHSPLELARQDTQQAVDGRQKRFEAMLSIAGAEGLLGRTEDAWKTMSLALAERPFANLRSYPGDQVFGTVLRQADAGRYDDAGSSLAFTDPDPGQRIEVLRRLASTAQRMARPHDAKALLRLARHESRLVTDTQDRAQRLLEIARQQDNDLADMREADRTLSEILSLRDRIDDRAERDRILRTVTHRQIWLDNPAAALRTVGYLHDPSHPEVLPLILSTRDREAVEDALVHVTEPTRQFGALVGVIRRMDEVGASPDDVQPLERRLSEVVEHTLSIESAEDRYRKLEFMAGRLSRAY